MSRDFPTPSHALCWLAEGTLTTVDGLSLRTRVPENEIGRQIAMAQNAIEHLLRFGFTPADATQMRCPRVAREITRTMEKERAVKGWRDGEREGQ